MTDPPVEPPPVGAGAGQAPVRRPWHWRPASRAAVIGWWLASLAVVALPAVLTGVVGGGGPYAGTSGEGFAGLAA
ncbi:MAG TPA: hypothetical protein PKB06_00775, partial [Actinotalea sp.]|nr:hypothetical protein [Actinotalea sp.]